MMGMGGVVFVRAKDKNIATKIGFQCNPTSSYNVALLYSEYSCNVNISRKSSRAKLLLTTPSVLRAGCDPQLKTTTDSMIC